MCVCLTAACDARLTQTQNIDVNAPFAEAALRRQYCREGRNLTFQVGSMDDRQLQAVKQRMPEAGEYGRKLKEFCKTGRWRGEGRHSYLLPRSWLH